MRQGRLIELSLESQSSATWRRGTVTQLIGGSGCPRSRERNGGTTDLVQAHITKVAEVFGYSQGYSQDPDPSIVCSEW